MLTDHIQRNSSTRGLTSLAEMLFLLDRYEAGNELAKTLMDEKVPTTAFGATKFVPLLKQWIHS